jgi:hypothetical protein
MVDRALSNSFRYFNSSPEVIRLADQKCVTIHASIYNHFNLGRYLSSREPLKVDRSAALAE